jgi:hypothetical protein
MYCAAGMGAVYEGAVSFCRDLGIPVVEGGLAESLYRVRECYRGTKDEDLKQSARMVTQIQPPGRKEADQLWKFVPRRTSHIRANTSGTRRGSIALRLPPRLRQTVKTQFAVR